MSLAVSAIQATGVRAGLCPHGLPPGACPICSGMGGAGRVVTADFSAKPGEMSWNECAAIGAFLKSIQNARLAREADYQNQIIAMAQFQNNMSKMAANLQTFIQNMSQSALTKPIAMVAQNMVLPVINFMKDLPVKFLQMTANIAQKLTDITDKLTAIYGELKAAIDKKYLIFLKKSKRNCSLSSKFLLQKMKVLTMKESKIIKNNLVIISIFFFSHHHRIPLILLYSGLFYNIFRSHLSTNPLYFLTLTCSSAFVQHNRVSSPSYLSSTSSSPSIPHHQGHKSNYFSFTLPSVELLSELCRILFLFFDQYILESFSFL